MTTMPSPQEQPQPSPARRWMQRIAGLALLALSLTACVAPLPTPQAPAVVVRPAPQQPVKAADDGANLYHLSVGDLIEIKFFYNPELNEAQAIRPDGRISMQLVGELHAAGLTTGELEGLLKQKYDGIVKVPRPTVFVRKYVQQRVYVGGQVNTPVVVPVEGPVTLMQAVFHAGGFRFNAEKRNVLVFRNNGLPSSEILVVNLEQQLEPVPPSAQCTPGQPCQNDGTILARIGDITLLPNDIVYVPQTTIGQVAQFMDENIGKIIPLYRNMGVNLYYQLNKSLNTTTTITPP